MCVCMCVCVCVCVCVYGGGGNQLQYLARKKNAKLNKLFFLSNLVIFVFILTGATDSITEMNSEVESVFLLSKLYDFCVDSISSHKN